MSAPADAIFGHLVLPDEQPRAAIDGTLAGLVNRAQAGDAAAFARLVTQFEDRIFATTFGLLRNRADALDAVQETFVRLYKYLGRYDPKGDLGAWLYRIAVNVSLRLAKRRKRLWAGTPAQAFPADAGDSADAGLVSRDLGRALETLTPNERLALVLRDFEGLTTDEVAQTLGSTATTVRVHICAARKKIRRFFDHEITSDGEGTP